MRIAVLSDIHGNIHALDAVLADVEREDVHAVWCLGDIVGYGADPNDCCERVREQADLVLAGNHDMAVTGDLSLEEFSSGAAIAARWTQEVLHPDHAAWLRGRAPAGETRDIGVYHASPRDPVWEYVLSSLLAELCFDAMRQRVALVGHSHVALAFVPPGGEGPPGDPRRGGDAVALAHGEWILNPG